MEITYSCWRTTVVASFQASNPLITNAICALLAGIFSSLKAFARIWKSTEQMTSPLLAATFVFQTRLIENFALPQLVSHILTWESLNLPVVWFLNDWRVVLEFTDIKIQHLRTCTIRTIIAFKTAHAEYGVGRKLPSPLPGQPGRFLRPSNSMQKTIPRAEKWTYRAILEVLCIMQAIQMLWQTRMRLKNTNERWCYPLGLFGHL